MMHLEPKLTYLPDETVFSLASRLRRLWGLSSAGQLARVLFGNEWSGRRHDFPCGLGTFAAKTEGAAGEPREAARTHTLLRYYLPFKSEAEGGRALHSMLRRGSANTRGWLGLPPSKLGFDHPLKACPVCIRQSVEEFGWTYWLLAHQFPGVWICPRHEEPLMIRVRSGRENTWEVPALQDLDRIWATRLKTEGQDRLIRLAHLSILIVNSKREDGWFQFRTVSPALTKELMKKWQKNGAGFDAIASAATDSWAKHRQALILVPEFWKEFTETQLWCGQKGSAWLGAHPLQIVLAIDWLFGDLVSFEAARAATEGDASR